MDTIDIFLSHSSKNFEIAYSFKKFLESEGVKCWIAPNDILPWKTWPQAIAEAITNSKVLIVFLSEHSQQSRYVTNELNIAFEYGKPILPCRIEQINLQTSPFALFIAGTHSLDIFDSNWEKNKKEVLNRVVSILGEQPEKPEIPTFEIIPVDKYSVLLDKDTNLMWLVKDKLLSEGSKPYAEAEGDRDYFNTKKLGGFSDWRLPTVQEFGTLNRIVDNKPLFRKIIPVGNTSKVAWTSSEVPNEGHKMWTYIFEKGMGEVSSKTAHAGAPYLVRSFYRYDPRKQFANLEEALGSAHNMRNAYFGKVDPTKFNEATKVLSLNLPKYFFDFTPDAFVRLCRGLTIELQKQMEEFVASCYGYTFRMDGTTQGYADLARAGAQVIARMEADFPGITGEGYKLVSQLFTTMHPDPDPKMQEFILYSIWKKCGKI